MHRLAVVVALAFALAVPLLALFAPAAAAQEQRRPPAVAFSVTGTVDPASAAWVREALEDAARADAPLVVLRLDTPGGLDASMRGMVRAITAAPMPVVVHVAPDGARAASAGLFVALAADVAAMAPGTNIGAATPVQLGGAEPDDVLGRKVENDAAAYARALAEARGRNADLAERAVREAESVSAEQAARHGLVDLVAEDRAALLERLDGRELPDGGVLRTAALEVHDRETPLQYRLQGLVVDPTVAYLLLLGGLVGIVVEVLSPGLVGPGLFGVVAFLLGLYGTAQLPVTAAGVVLLVLAVGFLAAETQVPTGGVLATAGAAGLVAGGLLLYDTDSEALALSVPAVLAAAVALGGFMVLAAAKALALRSAPARDPRADVLGAEGTVRVALEPVGQVFVEGALWRARVAEGEPHPARGARVRVEAVDGLTLTVRPVPSPGGPTP